MARSDMTDTGAPAADSASGAGDIGAVLESLLDGVVVVDRQRRVKAYNRRYAELFDLSSSEIEIGMSLEALMRQIARRGGLNNDPREVGREVAERLAAWDTEAARFERRPMPDGRVLDVYRSRTADGDVVAVHIDVTQKIAHERALERQRAYLLSLLENISDGVTLIDEEGHFVAFNRRFLELYGVDPGDAHWGMHFFELAEFFADLKPLSTERRRVEIAKRYRFATDANLKHTLRNLFNGRTLEVVKAILPEGGCVMTLHDVTDTLRQRRVLEEERRHAEATSRHKSRFLARMSHEMRTPLNGILGIAALLEHTDLDDQQSKFVDVLRNSGTVLLRLIDDLLDTARIEGDEFELVAARFVLAEIVDEAVAVMEPDAQNKGLRLFTQPGDAALPPLVGDAVRIKQVLLNLLSNAVKFTPSGQVTIGVQAELRDQIADLRIAVADTGIGIAPEDRRRIFNHFYQVDEQMSRNTGGVGLGLAISDRLIRSMGGHIDVESTLGHGSRFVIHLNLPLATEEADAVDEPLSAAELRQV
ncbi:MAG: PAS-domain containing protein [Pseudomonadota bacterium]